MSPKGSKLQIAGYKRKQKCRFMVFWKMTSGKLLKSRKEKLGNG